jgi:Domain of unknown function (DUF4175)
MTACVVSTGMPVSLTVLQRRSAMGLQPRSPTRGQRHCGAPIWNRARAETTSPTPTVPWAMLKARSARAISDRAVDGQGRAIDAMRKGAQGLAQQLQRQMGQCQGPGPNGQPGRLGPARAQQDTDPLGGPLRGRDYGDDTTVKVPGEIDAQRARHILEELRRRFGEALRPQLELDYIERLLKDYELKADSNNKETSL